MGPAQALHERARDILRAEFDQAVLEAPGEDALFVRLGAIGVRVQAVPAGGDDAVLELYSWVARGLPVTPEVATRLVARNIELHFGALAVDQEGAIILQHALFPESVAAPVLPRLVRVLAETAEALDRELRGVS